MQDSNDKPSAADPDRANNRLFLSTLYSEIDLARAGPDSAQTLTTVQNLIRLVRTTMFVQNQPENRRAGIERRSAALKPTDPAVRHLLSAVADDVRNVHGLQARRLAEAVWRLGYPVLSICLWSATFRHALTTGKPDTEHSCLSWDEKLTDIAENTSSLELFAKTHSLNYHGAITASDNHFQTFLLNKGNALTNDDVIGLQGGTFGIQPADVVEKHQIDPDVLNPHMWVLPLDKNAAATRPTISYSNTDQLKLENPGGEDRTEFNDRFQEDIEESIILTHYAWPNMKQWPEDDPRYAGFEDYKCEKCERKRGLIPKTRKPASKDARFGRCPCKLPDLDCYVKPLVELFATGRMGTGVRTLQNVGTDKALGEYTGEIYPSFKKGRREQQESRYGADQGSMYRLELPIVRRHATLPRKRKADETSSGTSEAVKKRQKTAKSKTKVSNAEEKKKTAAALDANEYVTYVIDSALKGNWTRYVNHSCDPNTEFLNTNIGMRTVPQVKTLRNFEFGEEITISYGADFLKKKQMACRCGVSSCLRWNPDDGGNEGVEFLSDAVEKGKGPTWIGGRGNRGRRTKKAAAARAAEILLDKVIEVIDKDVIKAAKSRRNKIRKDRGYTVDKASKARKTKAKSTKTKKTASKSASNGTRVTRSTTRK